MPEEYAIYKRVKYKIYREYNGMKTRLMGIFTFNLLEFTIHGMRSRVLKEFKLSEILIIPTKFPLMN
jgi:hypothetical protein